MNKIDQHLTLKRSSTETLDVKGHDTWESFSKFVIVCLISSVLFVFASLMLLSAQSKRSSHQHENTFVKGKRIHYLYAN